MIIDKLSYASRGFERLKDSGIMDRVTCWPIDLCTPITPGMRLLLQPDRIEFIIHMAADTHVDNSISDPVPFVQNNVNSTLQLLEFARTLPNLKRFVYFCKRYYGENRHFLNLVKYKTLYFFPLFSLLFINLFRSSPVNKIFRFFWIECIKTFH